ncbi:MAG: UvrD-helicase domain-containing protein [Alistipes indistinctus]
MGSVSIVRASAGSGKTYRLAYEYIAHVIANPWLYRNILAVTFTNKATEEMKQRIMGELNALASGTESSCAPPARRGIGAYTGPDPPPRHGSRTKILHDYKPFLRRDHRAKFFQRIIRSFLKEELGIDANFTLELQTDSILDSATDRMIEEMAVNEPLREWITRFAEREDRGQQTVRTSARISANWAQRFSKRRCKSLTAGSLPKEELSRVLGEAIGRSRAVTNTMQRDWTGSVGRNCRKADLTIGDFAYGRSGAVSGYFVKTSEESIVSAYGQRVSRTRSGPDEKWYGKKSPRYRRHPGADPAGCARGFRRAVAVSTTTISGFSSTTAAACTWKFLAAPCPAAADLLSATDRHYICREQAHPAQSPNTNLACCTS